MKWRSYENKLLFSPNVNMSVFKVLKAYKSDDAVNFNFSGYNHFIITNITTLEVYKVIFDILERFDYDAKISYEEILLYYNDHNIKDRKIPLSHLVLFIDVRNNYFTVLNSMDDFISLNHHLNGVVCEFTPYAFIEYNDFK